MDRKFIAGFVKRKEFRGVNDEELVHQFSLSHQDEIIDELFERYIHLVFGLCIKYLKNEEHARDMAMIIFEDLAGKLQKFEIKHFKSWLYTVARNACLMELRKKKHEIPLEQSKIIFLGHVENEEILHLSDEKSIQENAVILKMAKLSSDQRTCLDMMYFQNQSYKDIAEKTGLSLKQVKSHIQNGKRNLRNMLSDEEGED